MFYYAPFLLSITSHVVMPFLPNYLRRVSLINCTYCVSLTNCSHHVSLFNSPISSYSTSPSNSGRLGKMDHILCTTGVSDQQTLTTPLPVCLLLCVYITIYIYIYIRINHELHILIYIYIYMYKRIWSSWAD